MPGFDNDNAYFLGVDTRGVTPIVNQMNVAGELLIATGSATAPFIVANTLTQGAGISITNGPGTITIANTGVITANTITGDTGGALTPNWSILGQQAGTVAVMDTVGTGPSTLRVEDRAWQTQLVVDPSATVGLRGTFTTITLALAAAVSGQTIFLRPGTYTENITLKAGVNITGWPSDGYRDLAAATNNVTIVGTMTMTTAGTAVISNVALQTNSASILSVTGTAVSLVYLKDCYLNCTNSTGLVLTSSASDVRLIHCGGSLGTTGIAFFALSGGGNLEIDGGLYINPGNSTTANTWSAGILTISNCAFGHILTSSGASPIGANIYNVFFNPGNLTPLTHGNTNGTQISMWNCYVGSGSASAITVGASASLFLADCIIDSTNTNAITGLGSIEYSNIVFSNTSSEINTTTQTFDYDQLGKYRAQGQPAFSAYLASVLTDATGDGTAVTLGSGTALTEFYDVGGVFNTNGTFTAPVTGKYHFDFGILALQGVATMTADLQLVTTGQNYIFGNYGTIGTGNWPMSSSRTVQMTAGNTATVTVTFGNGTKTVDIYGAASDPRTYFSGYLVA